MFMTWPNKQAILKYFAAMLGRSVRQGLSHLILHGDSVVPLATKCIPNLGVCPASSMKKYRPMNMLNFMASKLTTSFDLVSM